MQCLLIFQIYYEIYCHTHLKKERRHSQCFSFLINKFKRHWHIIVILAHVNLSLSTQKAGLLEMNYSLPKDGKAKILKPFIRKMFPTWQEMGHCRKQKMCSGHHHKALHDLVREDAQKGMGNLEKKKYKNARSHT